MNIKSLKTHDELIKAFDVLTELRTHLTNKESFVAQVIDQQDEGYEIIAFEDNGVVVACIVFRFLTTLA